MEGALRHVLADALGSVGAMVAAAIIILTGWRYADPLVSVAIGLLILGSSWTLLRDSTNILLEATPRGLNAGEVGRRMAAAEGIVEVHDLHIWTITSGFPALSAHVLVGRHEDCHLAGANSKNSSPTSTASPIPPSRSTTWATITLTPDPPLPLTSRLMLGLARTNISTTRLRVSDTRWVAEYVVCGLYRETVRPMGRLKRWAQRLRVEVYALYLAYKDRGCPGMRGFSPRSWSRTPSVP